MSTRMICRSLSRPFTGSIHFLGSVKHGSGCSSFQVLSSTSVSSVHSHPNFQRRIDLPVSTCWNQRHRPVTVVQNSIGDKQNEIVKFQQPSSLGRFQNADFSLRKNHNISRFSSTESESTHCSYYKRLGASVIIGSLLSYGVYQIYTNLDLDINTPSLKSLISPPVLAESHLRNNFIADVVEKAAPAVVFLEIKGRHPLTRRPVTLSNGSGFIVRSHGIIITNAHVVANNSTVSVKLQDGRVFEGQVTAVDPISDLATVKIKVDNLPVIPLGASSELRPGEWVIAMGSPLSLSNTVTCGIVSSTQRASKELGLRNKDMDYIQTDAVINFGNSGGPLVDLEGRAIGINTMRVTTGISFAIPSDYVQKFLTKAEALMKKGETSNGFLKRRFMGITMLTLTENVMHDLKNNAKVPIFPDVDAGVFVYKVIPGSPAHVGGILAGDIIIDIGGKVVKSAADVYDAVEKAKYLQVTVIRGQHKKVIPIDTQETI